MINWLNPAKWSLSRKFLSIVLLILLIPLASIGLLKEIEKTLVTNLRDNLLLSARLIGNQLSQNKVWFEESLLPDSSQFLAKELFVFPLNQAFNLDGYFEDWSEYEQHRDVFFNTGVQKNTGFSVLLGRSENHLILSLEVVDKVIIFPTSDGQFLSDRFDIEFKNQLNELDRVFLVPKAAGSFPVTTKKNDSKKIDWRYKATMVTTERGYNIELKFPSGIRPDQIKITQKNIDSNQQNTYDQIISSSHYEMNPLVWPSKKLVNYVEQVELAVAQRIWVIDTRGRVLVSAGSLKASEISFSSNPVLNWILAGQSKLNNDPRANRLHLDSEEIYLAQKGIASSRVENINNSELSIALAAFPVKNHNYVYGVVLLEENVARVQILQKKTLINMFVIILTVFLLVMWIIFWYVSRMVRRIKTLNQAIDKSVDQQGRMITALEVSTQQGDEIDDLSRAFSLMGAKLYDYNDYLEKLASRLSHELRTPIAIVRSSLDNLLLNCRNEDKEIIERALLGNERLGEIITRMRQASGVKDAMQTAEKENINIEIFLTQIIEGYSQSFTDFQFQLSINLLNKQQMIAPELFAEMLDKLIANAMEFCVDNKPIVIILEQLDEDVCLHVQNNGPIIAKKDRKKIFQSLVSIRTNQQITGTNLGLGLYVVRLIAEFHNARSYVQNLKDESGVIFSVIWKTSKNIR